MVSLRILARHHQIVPIPESGHQSPRPDDITLAHQIDSPLQGAAQLGALSGGRVGGRRRRSRGRGEFVSDRGFGRRRGHGCGRGTGELNRRRRGPLGRGRGRNRRRRGGGQGGSAQSLIGRPVGSPGRRLDHAGRTELRLHAVKDVGDRPPVLEQRIEPRGQVAGGQGHARRHQIDIAPPLRRIAGADATQGVEHRRAPAGVQDDDNLGALVAQTLDRRAEVQRGVGQICGGLRRGAGGQQVIPAVGPNTEAGIVDGDDRRAVDLALDLAGRPVEIPLSAVQHGKNFKAKSGKSPRHGRAARSHIRPGRVIGDDQRDSPGYGLLRADRR